MIGYDLSACLDYNGQSFSKDDIAHVLANVEGEHDGAAYHWVLALKDNTWAYLVGWCDYTGWDCQSGAHSFIEPSLTALMEHFESDVKPYLMDQLRDGRTETWREMKDRELGVTSGVKLTAITRGEA